MLPLVTGQFYVGTDPELRFAPSGMAVCKFRAAASSSKKGDDGEWQKTGEIWVGVTTFGALAEHCAETVSKGDQVTLVGRIEEETWTTKDNEERKAIKVIADAVQTMPKRDRNNRSSSGGGQQQRQQSQSEDPWGPSTQTEEPPF